jgi:SsrA-binding protein
VAKKGKRKASPGDLATNRQASFRYHLLEKLTCGIALTGSEVKSIRAGQVQLKDAYASIDRGELYLHNAYIAPYEPASRANHDPERTRKLLARRNEIERLIGKTKEKGLTLVPTRLMLQGRNVKVEIALAQGKTSVDKRAAIREREAKREMERALRYRSR